MNEAALQPLPAAVHPYLDFNVVPDVIVPRRDKDEVRARLLDQLESVLVYLFPRGKRRGKQFVVGNLQGAPGDSLVVELEGPKRGLWIDFETGESGDVLALWASVRGCTLPDAGGAVPLFAPDATTRGPATTAAWTDLERQLKAMPDLRVVVLDPLQSLCALDLNVPENAQFVCSCLAALAASTGASVIVSHHFAKREASTPEQAREAIQGTGGLVDGVRSVYAL